MSGTKIKQYVLLPPRELKSSGSSPSNIKSSFFQGLTEAGFNETKMADSIEAVSDAKMRVVDSIRKNGPKLVEMSEEGARLLRANQPQIHVAPVLYYNLALSPRYRVKEIAGGRRREVSIRSRGIKMRIVDSATQKGVEDCMIVAFTDFDNRIGAMGETDNEGTAILAFGKKSIKIERLYVYPPLAGYWGVHDENVIINSGDIVRMDPIDLSFTDALKFFCGQSKLNDGRGVTVGVIDTGCGPHKDLKV